MRAKGRIGRVNASRPAYGMGVLAQEQAASSAPEQAQASTCKGYWVVRVWRRSLRAGRSPVPLHHHRNLFGRSYALNPFKPQKPPVGRPGLDSVT